MTKIAPGTVYRITEPTLAIQTDQDGVQTPVTLPREAILVIQDSEIEGSTYCQVDWDKKTLMVFSVDLESRGVCVESVTE
jgi:hypothetical protein